MKNFYLMQLLCFMLLIGATSGHYEKSYNEYKRKVKDMINMLKDKEDSDLLKIVSDKAEEYYVRDAASQILSERKDKKIIKALYEIYKEEKVKCMALPLVISEFRAVCKFLGSLSKTVTMIELSNLKKTERIHKMIDYIKIGNVIYNDCVLKKLPLDKCIEGSDDLVLAIIYSETSRTLLGENKFDVEEIREILKYKDDESYILRAAVISALINNNDVVTLDDLITFLHDDNLSNRYMTVKGIEKLGDKRAIPYLKKVSENNRENEKVREAAKEAIEKLSK